MDSISFGLYRNFTSCLEVYSLLEVCDTNDAVLKDWLEWLFSFQFVKNRSSFKCFEVPMLQRVDIFFAVTFFNFPILSIFLFEVAVLRYQTFESNYVLFKIPN